MGDLEHGHVGRNGDGPQPRNGLPKHVDCSKTAGFAAAADQGEGLAVPGLERDVEDILQCPGQAVIVFGSHDDESVRLLDHVHKIGHLLGPLRHLKFALHEVAKAKFAGVNERACNPRPPRQPLVHIGGDVLGFPPFANGTEDDGDGELHNLCMAKARLTIGPGAGCKTRK